MPTRYFIPLGNRHVFMPGNHINGSDIHYWLHAESHISGTYLANHIVVSVVCVLGCGCQVMVVIRIRWRSIFIVAGLRTWYSMYSPKEGFFFQIGGIYPIKLAAIGIFLMDLLPKPTKIFMLCLKISNRMRGLRIRLLTISVTILLHFWVDF